MVDSIDLPEKDAFTIDEVAAFFGKDSKTVLFWLERGVINGCVRFNIGSRSYEYGQHKPQVLVSSVGEFPDEEVRYKDGELWRLSTGVVKQLIVESRVEKSEKYKGTKGDQRRKFHFRGGFGFEPPTAEAHEYDELQVYMYNAPYINLDDVLVSRVERDRFVSRNQETDSLKRAANESVGVLSNRTGVRRDKGLRQREAICGWLSGNGYELNALPADQPGEPGIKSLVRKAMTETQPELFDKTTNFNRAWELLSANKEIQKLKSSKKQL